MLDQKPSHPLEDGEHGSPPAAKKRRMGSGLDGDGPVQSPFVTDQHGPGHKIEEELATALGENVADTVESTDRTQAGQDQSEASAATATRQDASSSANPDVASLISEIMDHTERQEQTVSLGPQEVPPSGDFPGARGYAFLKANSHLKIQSLPILDNLVSLHHPVAALFTKLTSLPVHANPVFSFQEQLPRSHCHGV